MSDALFVSDGAAIVTAGRDGAMRLWPVQELPQVAPGSSELRHWLDAMTTALPLE